ncbi:unnamed protein product [Sphagnum balticum]
MHAATMEGLDYCGFGVLDSIPCSFTTVTFATSQDHVELLRWEASTIVRLEYCVVCHAPFTTATLGTT